jgi:hypothetical protein
MALVASLAALWARSAHAERVGAIVRAAPDAPVTAAELTGIMERAGAGAGDDVVADAIAHAQARLAGGAVPAARRAELDRVRALAAAGWQAYLAVEPALAADQLAEARRLAEAALDLPEGPVIYADACLRLGVVLHQLGRAGEGDALMRLAATLDPGRTVSIAAFAPDVVSAYEAARGAEAPAVPVRITATLADAGAPAGPGAPAQAVAIEIDGRPAGAAPLALALPAGLHVVVARAPGHRSQARVVTVAAGPAAGAQAIAVALAPEPLARAVLRGPDALAAGSAGEDARAAVTGALAHGELDAVVLAASAWRRGAPALLGQRCALDHAGQALACTGVIEIGYRQPGDAAAAGRALWTALAGDAPAASLPGPTLLADARLVSPEARPGPSDAPRDAPRAPAARAGASPAPRWYRRPWLWIGVGAATAAAATTAWALARDGEAAPVIIVDPCRFGPCPAP